MNKQASIVEGRITTPGEFRGDKVYTVKWRWVGGETWFYLPSRYVTKDVGKALETARLVERNNSK